MPSSIDFSFVYPTNMRFPQMPSLYHKSVPTEVAQLSSAVQ